MSIYEEGKKDKIIAFENAIRKLTKQEASIGEVKRFYNLPYVEVKKGHLRITLPDVTEGAGLSEFEVTVGLKTMMIDTGIIEREVTKLYTYGRLQQERELHYNKCIEDMLPIFLKYLQGETAGGTAGGIDFERLEKVLNEVRETKCTKCEASESEVKEKKTGTVKGKEGRKKSLSQREIHEVKRLWGEGETSLRKLGEKFKVSHQTIKNVLKD